MKEDIQSYIDSGVLELYVSGQLPEEEAREVARMATQHPEVENELKAIEASLGAYLGAFASQGPSDHVLSAALAQIEAEAGQEPESGSDEPLVKPLTPSPEPALEERAEATSRGGASWRYLAIAASVLLLVSLGINLLLYQNLQSVHATLAGLRAENQQFAQQNEVLQTQYAEVMDALPIMGQPDVQRVYLKGLENHPESGATVFWDPGTEEVFLYVQNLPQPEPDQQYQLWAIVDGQPVDAGVFDVREGVQKQKAIGGKAAAFAVTLEPAGGSQTPTLEQMYVIGNVEA